MQPQQFPIRWWTYTLTWCTSKTHTRRVAEVSSSKKCYTIGLKEKNAYRSCSSKPHIFSTLFCEFVLILHHPFSTVATTSQLRLPRLFSILLTTLLNSSQVFSSLPTSAQLFSPFPTSSQLFSTTLTSAHLFSPLLNPSAFTEKLAHGQAFTQSKLLHREAFTRRSSHTCKAR